MDVANRLDIQGCIRLLEIRYLGVASSINRLKKRPGDSLIQEHFIYSVLNWVKSAIAVYGLRGLSVREGEPLSEEQPSIKALSDISTFDQGSYYESASNLVRHFFTAMSYLIDEYIPSFANKGWSDFVYIYDDLGSSSQSDRDNTKTLSIDFLRFESGVCWLLDELDALRKHLESSSDGVDKV